MLMLWARLLAAPLSVLVVVAGYAVWAGEYALLLFVGGFVLVLVGGAVGSFVIHEVGHALILERCRGVHRVEIQSTKLRFSLAPQGVLTSAEAAAVAVAGPAACIAVGTGLAVFAQDLGLHWWYLVHAIFLVPPFGDGAALLRAWRVGAG
ncbi:hypothetical protein D3H59_19755 [Micromonospora endophytica]|nr:hypothetical protein D3H59_19755 [Micromonospora endophytica]